MSPISGTHLRLPCFGFSLTNTIFERAILLRLVRFLNQFFAFPLKFRAGKHDRRAAAQTFNLDVGAHADNFPVF